MADTPRRFDIEPPQALLVWPVVFLGIAIALVGLAFAARHGRVHAVAVLPALLIAGALVTVSVLRLRVELVGRTLRVVAGLMSTRVDVANLDLAGARILNLDAEPELSPRFKTYGTSMPGLRAGKFRLRGGLRGFILVTNRHRVLLLPRKDGSLLLLSLQQPQSLLDALQRMAGRNPGA